MTTDQSVAMPDNGLAIVDAASLAEVVSDAAIAVETSDQLHVISFDGDVRGSTEDWVLDRRFLDGRLIADPGFSLLRRHGDTSAGGVGMFAERMGVADPNFPLIDPEGCMASDSNSYERVYVCERANLFLIATVDTEPVPIVLPGLPETFVASEARFSHDGTRLLVAVQESVEQPVQYVHYVLTREGSAAAELAGRVECGTAVGWAPDDEILVWLGRGCADASSRDGLHLLDPSTQSLEQIWTTDEDTIIAVAAFVSRR